MSESAENPVKLRRIAILVLVVSVVAAIVLGWMYFARSYTAPLSEDAVLSARVARIAASVPGRVSVLEVQENSTVVKGQLLFSLDPEMYQLQVELASAAHQAAQAALQTRLRSISAESSNVTIADEQIQRAKINAAQSAQTLKRLQSLAPKGYVTAQQVDDAKTLLRNAETSLREAQAQQDAARALVGTTDAEMALVAQTRAQLAIAERQLRDTKVYAPNDGRIAGMSIAVGDYMLPAQSAFSLIDTTQWYASAGYLETELSKIRPGMCAIAYVAEDRSRTIKGSVESIGWGVMSGDEIPIPRSLPYVPKTLNWVRVGQRFPVRVILDAPPQELMRAGASATVIIQTDEQC